MCKPLVSIVFVLLTTCLFSSVVTADEVFFEEDKTDPSVSVLCYGRLRHGVVAVGCETTGTTITFHRMTWELQLADEASREFAKLHHKEPVVVTGTLRKVVGTENMVRWIIDVDKLSEHDSRDLREQEGVQMTIRGTLRSALSRTRNTPELSINTEGQNWQLDFVSDGETQTVAESLVGQPVLLTGSLKPLPEEIEDKTTRSHSPATHFVRVKSIEASANTAIAPRLFR